MSEVEAKLPTLTRKIIHAPDLAAWYDVGHPVAIYEAVLGLRGLPTTREIGRDAARFAMVTVWRDLMHALLGFLGGTPRMAFEQMPVLWSATRRDSGELRCVESSTRHAVTELRGFPYAASVAWCEVWQGHHEALLRQLRFTGTAKLTAVDAPAGIVRVHTEWGGALRGTATNKFVPPAVDDPPKLDDGGGDGTDGTDRGKSDPDTKPTGG